LRVNLAPFGTGLDFTLSSELTEKSYESVTSLALFPISLILLFLPGVIESAFQCLDMILEDG
jgi:hypothetical protein